MTEEREERSVGVAQAFGQYLRETRGEVRKVTWPSRAEATRLTGVVLGVTLAMTIFLYSFDYLFSQGLKQLITLIAR